MESQPVSPRYALTESDPHHELDAFATAVASGLGAQPKTLPCRFLYDERGSELFEEICELPEYYLTRAERRLLARHADAIAARLPTPVALAELGSGSSSKTRLLIEALLRRQPRLRYVPIDISRSILEESAEALLADYRGLEIHAIAGEYQDGLRHVRGDTRAPKLIAWLGSNVGNFDRHSAARFLRGIREVLTGADRLLVGIDLRKDRARLLRAYDDAAGVTARFNLNLLGRINRELDGGFDLARFAHRAEWREVEGRVKLVLESREAQEVPIRGIDRVVRFEKGEHIHTEDSYKYDFGEIDDLASTAGLALDERWLEETAGYSLNLLRPA
jgi:dimethylhistidine N-methyltransferase